MPKGTPCTVSCPKCHCSHCPVYRTTHYKIPVELGSKDKRTITIRTRKCRNCKNTFTTSEQVQ